MKDFFKQLKNGFISNNPVLIQLLGMCSALAITTNLKDSFGMGVAVTAVLICSNLFISLLRSIIPDKVRIAAYIVVISGFVTAVQLLIKAFLPALDKSLGIFIPLIVVNCIIFARAEAFASKNTVVKSVVDGISMGLGYTFAICLVGIVREFFGSGSILGYKLGSFGGAAMITTSAGGFLALGCILAAVRAIASRLGKKKGGDDK